MSTINFDVSRGVDFMRGSAVVLHFDGPDALELAWAHARTTRGGYVRYWTVKEEK